MLHLWLAVLFFASPLLAQQCPGTEEGFSDVRTQCSIGASDLNTWFDTTGNVLAAEQDAMIKVLQAAGTKCLCAVEDWYKTFGSCPAATRATDSNWTIVTGLRLAGKCSDCERSDVEEGQFNECVPDGCLGPMTSFSSSPKDTLSKASAEVLCGCYTDLVKCWSQKSCFTTDSCNDNIDSIANALDAISYDCALKKNCGTTTSTSTDDDSDSDSKESTPSDSDKDSDSKSEDSDSKTSDSKSDSDSDSDSDSESGSGSDSSESGSDSDSESKGLPNWGIVLIVVAGILVLLLLIGFIGLRMARRRNNRRPPPHKDYHNSYNNRGGGGGAPPQMYNDYASHSQQQTQPQYEQYGAPPPQPHDQYNPNPMGNMPPHSPPHGGPPMSPGGYP